MITEILRGIRKSFDSNDEVIFLFDACTDKSQEVFDKNNDIGARKILPDAELFEIKANNVLLREAKNDIIILFQDDMVCDDPHIKEKIANVMDFYGDSLGLLGGRDGFELKELTFPEKPVDKISSWSHRPTSTIMLKEWEFKERTILNRGPLVFTRKLLHDVGYLDEAFYPLWGDDMDYCCRAKFDHNRKNVVFQCDIRSPLEWGTLRSNTTLTPRRWRQTAERNWNLFISRWGGRLLAT